MNTTTCPEVRILLNSWVMLARVDWRKLVEQSLRERWMQAQMAQQPKWEVQALKSTSLKVSHRGPGEGPGRRSPRRGS
jgi:hypothetical protein